MPQQLCLKWNNHMPNMMDVFKNLLATETMVDVTLACDGLSLKAHKIVLSACSPFFRSLFLENPCKHPIVILKDMKYDELRAIIEFMYHGEVNIAQDQLSALMKIAETLRVQGLVETKKEKSGDQEDLEQKPVESKANTPSSKRKKRLRKRLFSDSESSNDESETMIKRPSFPEIEKLHDVTLEPSSHYSSSKSQVSSQKSSHSKNTSQKSNISRTPPEKVSFHPGESFTRTEQQSTAEPPKLLKQTVLDDVLSRKNRESSVASNLNTQRELRSMDHSSVINPALVQSEISDQRPESPADVKPVIDESNAIVLAAAVPSRSPSENSAMNQSSFSLPETSFNEGGSVPVGSEGTPTSAGKKNFFSFLNTEISSN